MANVTVLGAGGSTVTISLSSTDNATTAQLALNGVSSLVTSKVLEQVTYSGTGTVPAPTKLLGGLIIDKAADAGALVSQYVSAVVTGTGKSTIVGTANSNVTVVSGDGADLTYWNLSANADVTLGKASNFFIAGDKSGGTVAVDAAASNGGTVIQTFAGSNTKVNVTDKSLSLLLGDGNATVAVAAGANAVVGVTGAGTVPVTITGTSGSLQYLALGGKAIINPGAADVTVYGNVGSGTASVFGTSAFIGGKTVTAPAFSGKLTVVDGQGYFAGGTGGGNLLFTSTVAGSATLQGGGNGDLLVSRGAGQVLIAGAGSETLSGFSVDASVGGSTFFAGGGNATIFGNTGGGNIFGFGPGQSLIDGRDETRAGALKSNVFFDAAKGGTHLISDFVSGTDQLNLSLTSLSASDATITFFAAGAGGSPFGAAAGTKVTLTSGTTILFFDTNKDGIQDFKASDIV